jgi:hypothetical protein
MDPVPDPWALGLQRRMALLFSDEWEHELSSPRHGSDIGCHLVLMHTQQRCAACPMGGTSAPRPASMVELPPPSLEAWESAVLEPGFEVDLRWPQEAVSSLREDLELPGPPLALLGLHKSSRSP